ncbi:hypothetical protein EJV44_11245 [Ancylobacter aquaticus]|nr:hypothetical protein EJV44_11245 [Ancylobacter aquaticus]
MADLNIKLNVGRMVAVEHYTGKSLNQIIRDTESDAGMSLAVLRGMLAAGTQPAALSMMGVSIGWEEERRADALLTEHGIAACASAVGSALAAFLRTIETRAA